MTREQAKKHLIALGVQEPTEQQITTYLNTIDTESNKATAIIEKNKQEIERLKKIEQEYEAEKEKTMTAEERAKKAEKAVELAQKNMEEKANDYARKISKLSAEAIFKGAGLTEEEYGSFIDGIVSINEDETKSRATALCEMMSAKLETQKAALEQSFEEERKKFTPNPNGGSGAGGGKPKAVELAEQIAKSHGSMNSSVIDYYAAGGKKNG